MDKTKEGMDLLSLTAGYILLCLFVEFIYCLGNNLLFAGKRWMDSRNAIFAIAEIHMQIDKQLLRDMEHVCYQV